MSRAGSAAEPPGSGGGGEKLLPRSDTADYGKVSRAMQLFGPRLVRSGAPYLSPNWIRRPFRRAGDEDPPKMDAVVHPVHDLVLSRILSWIAPSHVAPLAIKYAVVACWIVLVGFCASGFVLYKNSRIVAVLCETKFVKALASNPHYILNPKHVLVGTVVAMTIAALGAWTYRYRRVLRLAIDKWRFAATSDRPSLSWMEDPTVPAVNRLAMHVPLRLFDSEEMARHAAPVPRLVHSRENNGNASKTSQRVNITTPNVRLLDDHVWHFRLYENPSTAMEAVLHRSASILDEDSSLWSMIAVPSNWTRQGHDRPIYTNIKYPFPCEPPLAPVDNPTGVYRTTVRVPPKSVTDGSEVTILFHGVESALYVFWNRSFVGFSKDSRLEAEFDVTPYVNAKGDDHDGDPNELVVVVPRFCDGSYVEDQDHWWMAGIYRSVELVTRPRMASMLDYQVRADQHGAFTCRVECSAVVGTHYHVTAKLYDDRSLSADGDQLILGECVWTGTLPVESHSYHHPENVPPGDSATSLSPSDTWHGCYFSAEIDKKVLKRWTAETPNLYTLTLTLTVASGEQHRQGGGVRPAVAKVVQAESCRVGFRTVLIEDGQVRVNGRPITVCGMNRHEHDPDHGKTVSLESMKRDICLLKQNNFNSVRTSHYPNHVSFYHLCDFYGLYVCDEANIETHGMKPMGRLTHDAGWENAFVSRVMRLVHRDVNHPCVLYWSLGNEAGRGCNLAKARKLVKQWDPTRLVVYESGGALAEGTGRTELTDVICTMYPDVDRALRLATRVDEDRPVILCEYSHSMGNSNGNLHLYWKEFWNPSVPRLQGGYIWDMVDQGLRIPCDQPPGFYFGYGGDFGDEINDLQFCCNGMFSPDREPHPAVAEVKFLMQPVSFSPMADSEASSLRISTSDPFVELNVANRYTFIDLSHLRWDFEIVSSVSPTANYVGSFEVTSDRCRFKLDKALPKIHELEAMRPLAGISYFLNVCGRLKENVSWADRGHTLVSQQFCLEVVGASTPVLATPSISTPFALTISNDDNQLCVWRSESASREKAAEGRMLLVAIDRSSGSLVHYSPFGRNLLYDGVMPNFTRATTDNDRGGMELALNFLFPGLEIQGIHGLLHGNQDFSYWSRWRRIGLAEDCPPKTRGILTEVTFVDDTKVDIDVVSRVSSADGRHSLFTISSHFTVYHDGSVRLAIHTCPSRILSKVSSLPRVGIKMQLDKSLYRIQYFGRGPGENYPDRKAAAEMGFYETTPSCMGYTYIMPSENGSRSDCKWVSFRGVDGTGMCIASERSDGFSFSSLLHSATELNSAAHTCDLEARRDGEHPIHCSIDHRLMGLGGDTSWYPVVYPQYLVQPTDEFKYCIWLLPLEAQANPAIVAGNL